MTVLSICRLPHDHVLRQKAKKVSSIDTSLQHLIDNMIETMQSANGVGLAAPQIGKSLRIIVLQMPDEEPQVIINPEIVKRSGEQEVTEGCLRTYIVSMFNCRYSYSKAKGYALV